MTIYLDQPHSPCKPFGQGWCHMMVGKDDDLRELHVFAESIGLRKSYFQDDPRTPHYDLTKPKRELAMKKGVTVVNDIRLFVKRCFRESDEETRRKDIDEGRTSSDGEGGQKINNAHS